MTLQDVKGPWIGGLGQEGDDDSDVRRPAWRRLSSGDYRGGDLLRPGTLTRVRRCGKVVSVDHRVRKGKGAVVAVTAILDLQLKSDSLETAHGVLHATLTDTRAFPGCLGVTVLVDSDDPAHVVLYEIWESIERDRAYRAWRASTEGASELGSILAAAPKLGLFTVADAV